jgi:dihydrofolate reductase
MAGFWPTPAAAERFPVIAARMNSLPKVVFSRTLAVVTWANARLVKSSPAAEIRKMKSEPGPDMTILGSGSIVSQLTQEGLIDEYQVVVFPVVLGQGRTMFDGVTRPLRLRLVTTRTFGNGNVLLRYVPVA